MTMMFAKFPGRDSGTGERFGAGAVIDYDRWRKTVMLVKPGTAGFDLFMAQQQEKTVSDAISIGGQEFYRNRKGRCEDAPCCGCCTI